MSLPETIFARDRRGRKRLIDRGEPLAAVSAATKRVILEMLEAGATQTEIASAEGMPDYVTIWKARKDDAAFDLAFREAQAKGAEVMLSEAREHALDEIETRDPDRVRCALMMMDITTKYAEKIAPREFGPLVKLGSDPNAPLQLNVVSYALPTVAPLIQVDCADEAIIARGSAIEHTTQADDESAAQRSED